MTTEASHLTLDSRPPRKSYEKFMRPENPEVVLDTLADLVLGRPALEESKREQFDLPLLGKDSLGGNLVPNCNLKLVLDLFDLNYHLGSRNSTDGLLYNSNKIISQGKVSL